MKTKFLPLVFALFISLSAISQTGKVFDNHSVKSTILKSDRKFAIYLPQDYETSKRSYPVLFLLHGAGDDQTGWVQTGGVLHITDKAIKEGKATPMIIVMPDANTGKRGYFNDIKGDWNCEDFFFKELIPHVEKTYRVKADKRNRAIAGLSMGSGGTFMYALHQPELLSSACPLSAYVGPLNLDELKERLKRNNETYSGSDADLQTYFDKHNALSLIKSTDAEKTKSVKWFIDCGDDDFLYEGNSLVHITLKKKEIPHEFRIRDGAHN